MELTGIKDKIVLITGASGSVGRETAVHLARLGARLALTGRDDEKLNKTANFCKAAGALHVFTVAGDITIADDVKRIIDSTLKTYSGIDILINSAGMIKPGQFMETTMETYDQIFKTNLTGPFLVTKFVVPHLIERKGAIINVSSFTGIRPDFSYFAYAMAQSGVDQLTRALALELGPKGVRVNSVNPGVLKDSDFWTRQDAPMAGKSEEQIVEVQEKIKMAYPMKRLGECKDVASAIAFLCSEQSSFVHGVCLPVDGGKILTSKPARLPPKPKA